MTAGLGKGLDEAQEVHCATCHHLDEFAKADNFDPETVPSDFA
ncbi:hypothetical protein ACFH04_01455 [Streptomyces noboritoensis]|uniref:Cytochrome c domain-containing protein n=1 Tax=Streptomyces noboritoensis TaxID=67337 RepID=A0ABV6T9G9_9ACTN